MKQLFEKVENLDNGALEKYSLPSQILMEHAAFGLYEQIRNRFEKGSLVLIVAGSGNNGGDGLALARILMTYGYIAAVYMPNPPGSQDAIIQHETLMKLNGNFLENIENINPDVVVDALFGSGLNRKMEAWAITLIHQINGLAGLKVACDIPSGIKRDGSFEVCFNADITVTMGAAKVSLYLDRTKDYVGKIIVQNLGIPFEAYATESDIHLLEESDMHLPHRLARNSHKGTFGHLSVIMGNKHGAALMAAMAAIKFGSGLVTVITKDNYQVPPELMQAKKINPHSSVVVIGMGLGDKYIQEEIMDMLEGRSAVIDADLLGEKMIIDILESKKNLVITPHPKEFADLLTVLGHNNIDTATVQKNRFEMAKEFSIKYPNVVLLLKGANTIIARNGKLYVNDLGTQALAKGGSGDVLAGMIGSLIAQGYDILEATISASLAHGAAASNYQGNDFALTPMDLITEVAKLDL